MTNEGGNRRVRRRRFPRKGRRRNVMDELLERMEPCFESFHLPEPKLVFYGGGLSVDPKSGLADHGPVDAVPRTAKTIPLAVIGTGSGIDLFLSYLERCQTRVVAGFNRRGKPYDIRCFPDFPGWGEDSSLGCIFETPRDLQRIILDGYLDRAIREPQPAKRLEAVIELIRKELVILRDREPPPNTVVVSVMPHSVERECATIGHEYRREKLNLTPGQKLVRRLQRHSRKTGQGILPLDFDTGDEGTPGQTGFWNFHHALKAHSMKFFPTQLVWESTLDGTASTQDPASIAWNMIVALYYKAGNKPWMLESLPTNTCFVGVSFYKQTPFSDSLMQTSLAQVFGAGEGIVLKGQRALVDKNRGDSKPHLSESGAQELLEKAIDLYRKQNDNVPPSRVVVHKTSRYWPEELRGFEGAVEGITHHDFLTLETLGTRFMRVGHKPPLRGTVVKLAPQNFLIYTTGFIPYFQEYPGMRIPNPVEIVEHHGVSPMHDICRDILALTKLNWNSCGFGSSYPITIRFARQVGRIMTELPKGTDPKTQYKFYM